MSCLLGPAHLLASRLPLCLELGGPGQLGISQVYDTSSSLISPPASDPGSTLYLDDYSTHLPTLVKPLLNSTSRFQLKHHLFGMGWGEGP